MDETAEILTRCFQAIFPNLTAEQIPKASIDTLEAWDSLASVTLVAVLEEEFGIEIPAADLSELRSFATTLDYLRWLSLFVQAHEQAHQTP